MDAHRPTTAGPKFRGEIPPKLTKTENFKNPLFVLKNRKKAVIWARSSAGRAFGSHRYGRTSICERWPEVLEENASANRKNSKYQKPAFCSEKRPKSGNMGP